MTNSNIREDMENIIAVNLPWEKLYGKRILITGASGFIGSHITETLFALNDRKTAGIRVVGSVRNKSNNLHRLLTYKGRQDLEIISPDLSSPISIKGKIDYIIHAASQASPKYYSTDPVGTLLPNVIGTYNLLNLAKEKKTKGFLFISSGEVYGEVKPENIPTSENDYGYLDPINVRSCYAESKRMGENMCVSWSHQFGLDVKIARLFHVYGARMAPDDGRVQADFIQNILKGENILLKSDGSDRRTFCYISDAVSAIFTVLLLGEKGHSYNIGSSKTEISILDLAKLIVKIFPKKKLKVVRKKRNTDDKYLISSVKRACPDTVKLERLGWKPKIGLEEGFNIIITNYE